MTRLVSALVGVILAAAAVPSSMAGQTAVAPPRASAAAPAAPENARAPVTADYRLQVGDKLRVNIYKDDQLSQDVQIRPDGKITMPLAGDFTASGLTPLELRDQLTVALREYVNNPVVTVVVVEGTSPTAYVVGEVNRPGAVTVQGKLTVLQALAIVGGLKDFANSKGIRILRESSAGIQTIGFDYKRALKGSGPPVYLQPGDTVVVPD